MANNIQELRERFASIYTYMHSQEALQAVEDVLDGLEEDDTQDVGELLWQAMEDTFMYYSDAWDYMKDYGDTDLSDAVNNGFHTITQIAAYNCETEVYEIFGKIGLDW